MARSRTNRIWALGLWALCLLAATGGHVTGAGGTMASGGTTSAAVGVLSAAADPALLPARVADELRAATQTSPLRVAVLAALFGAVLGLAAALRRRASTAGRDHRPLQARRHTIALRAPPLQLA